MSHEFQVHHLLNELVSLLRVKGADVDIDSYADVLLKNRTPYVTTQVDKIINFSCFSSPNVPHNKYILYAEKYKNFYHAKPGFIDSYNPLIILWKHLINY